MPTGESSSLNRSKVKQYICYICSKTFDNIETLESHKRFEHSEVGRPQPLPGVS